jgi:CRISPR/Cas system-associated endonuclease Cas1
MIHGDSLFWRNVAEDSFLLVVVSAHSLASLTFFTSDEFFRLKLQKKWVFQQAANQECARRRVGNAPTMTRINQGRPDVDSRCWMMRWLRLRTSERCHHHAKTSARVPVANAGIENHSTFEFAERANPTIQASNAILSIACSLYALVKRRVT